MYNTTGIRHEFSIINYGIEKNITRLLGSYRLGPTLCKMLEPLIPGIYSLRD